MYSRLQTGIESRHGRKTPPRRHPSHDRRSFAESHEYAKVDGGVATITLNRPDNRNALSVELVDAVGDRLQAAQDDDAVRAVVLTNAGNTFCAGADLKTCLLYTSPSPRDYAASRMPSSA